MADPNATDDLTVPPASGPGATATLDPPVGSAVDTTIAPEPPFSLPSDWMIGASQTVSYRTDSSGKLRGADIYMGRGKDPLRDVTWATYRAAIRWEDGLFRWYEPDGSEPGGWKMVKRGQSVTEIVQIVEQAIEWATGRVFGSFPA